MTLYKNISFSCVSLYFLALSNRQLLSINQIERELESEVTKEACNFVSVTARLSSLPVFQSPQTH